MRRAFSFLELTFVVIILGIVSSIAAEIVAQVYESYIVQRAAQRSSIKTEIALTQIANRLSYAVPGTIIGKKSGSTGAFKALSDIDDTSYTILEWVGYDNDSFIANGWTGVADLSQSSSDALVTPGSHLTLANQISSNLHLGGIGGAAIFFPGTYSAYNIGYSSSSNSGVEITEGRTTDTFLMSPMAGRIGKEHYLLASSAYAIVPVNNGDGTFDLWLYYRFQPWQGTEYLGGNSALLLENVTVFKFQGTSAVIRLKICQKSFIGSGGEGIVTCKEKAVML